MTALVMSAVRYSFNIYAKTRLIKCRFNGVYDLRAKHIHMQYRINYFFHGQNVAILAHAITKEEAAVPPIDIERAISDRTKAFI